MKKIILTVFVAGLALTSCKKDRTCTCTITQVSSTDNGVTQPVSTGSETNVMKYTKVTKKGAGCVGGERTETSTETRGGTTHTMVDVSKADCKLD